MSSEQALTDVVEIKVERLERLRRVIGKAYALAYEWQEGAIMRRESPEVCDAFTQLAMLTHSAAQDALLIDYDEPEPGVFERLLATPGEQFDKDGVVAASILAAQRRADIRSPARCPHKSATTYPPGTVGGNPVTVCNDCGVYL